MDSDLKRQKIKEDIFTNLKQGIYKRDSAIMAGIDESTFYRWISEDASFASRVEASILEYKHTLVKNVTTCAERDGRLALEVLKRRFPKEWGDNVNMTENQGGNTTNKVVAEQLQKIYEQERENQHESLL